MTIIDLFKNMIEMLWFISVHIIYTSHVYDVDWYKS